MYNSKCLITFLTPELRNPSVVFFLTLFDFSRHIDCPNLQLSTLRHSYPPTIAHFLLYCSVLVSCSRFFASSSSHTANSSLASHQTSCLQSGGKNKCLAFSDLQMSKEIASAFATKLFWLLNSAASGKRSVKWHTSSEIKWDKRFLFVNGAVAVVLFERFI